MSIDGGKVAIATMIVVCLGASARACDLAVHDPSGIGVSVQNSSSLPLTFKLFAEGQVLPIGQSIPSHQGRNLLSRDRLENGTTFTKDGCTTGDLVAFGPDGSEVARHPPPLCVGEAWLIEEPKASVAH